MHCIKKVTEDLLWVGANDRRLAMFEGVYSVPKGVSYNSYLLLDDKTVLFDTVDKAVREQFLENLLEALGSRPLDYLVVQHMEPDHSAALKEIMGLYPAMRVVCNAKTLQFIKQFSGFENDSRAMLVIEGDTLETGRHTLRFLMAPMVHWPEVMVTYDSADKTLFSADAFGCFGALNGALFADEVDFAKDYMDETRRYYANIVGKYGAQTSALLEKIAALAIEKVCPLHGFVWRRNISDIIAKYALWSEYRPEEQGVMLVYASVYGHTENAAEILAAELRERGIKTEMFDVSVTPASEIVSAAFRWSHLVFASTTYNAGIFVTMEALVSDLAAHNLQNRTVAIIENGSWAPASGGLIRAQLEKCKDIRFLDETVSIRSGMKPEQRAAVTAMAAALALDFPKARIPQKPAPSDAGKLAREAMFKLSYGLFVLTARENGKDNGCIINTVTQITETPARISIAVNKANHTHDMILRAKAFNVSVLSEGARFGVYERFGFHSGRDTDKFAGYAEQARAENGVLYVTEGTNAVLCAKVTESLDYGSHTVFIAEITEARLLSDEPSATYRYYFEHVKPAPKPPKEAKKGFVCKICGFVYEGESLPADYICPLCKHGAQDFEPLIFG
jgi:flavorubredoxin/flavin reductase (DIM6/NTAB) family NADH-FMN oxidoreductase RutF